jgi:pimeloyl-ACP methyl ester carboxylesterase
MGTRVIVEHAASSLYVERGGNEGPLLLLIHGLASNGAVWDRLLPLVQRHWSGSYLIPDLRGHGKSPHTRPYSFGHFVTDLAGFVERGRKVAVIGHSLGGVLGALLASGWFGVDVRTVLALSVKTVWTDEELVKFEGVGNQEVRWMESQSDAAARYVKSSGLTGIVEAGERVVQRGITQQDGRYRFAADQLVYGSTGRNVGGIFREALCPVHFATGANDTMAPVEQHLPYDENAQVIHGAGHQVHLEEPDEIWRVFSAHWAKDEA